MPQPVSVRLVVICLDSARQLVNDTLRAVDPDSAGDPLTVQLRRAGDPTNTVVAWATSWAMEDATAQAFRAAIRDAGWRPRPSAAEQTVHGPGQAVPPFDSGQRVWLWDGFTVAFEDCLPLLGLDRLYYAPRLPESDPPPRTPPPPPPPPEETP